MTNSSDVRICIIGAGPAGMSALFQFAQTGSMPDIVCYEKQSTWGGIWNYTWRTGLDENNEACHSSLYKDLWTNAPKEANIEFPDYTFEKHFGRPVPSYPPAAAVRNYLEGRWTKGCSTDLKQYIQFNTVVRFVRFDEGKFVVTVDNRKKNKTSDEIFSHVIVCSGIFNFPNQPEVPGLSSFDGRILHSHNFRHGNEFKGQTVMVVGSHFSGEDIALHCLKFGANNVTISYRSKPTGLTWPNGIEERPLVKRVDATHAYFKDGSKKPVDAIIFCTGFKSHFPFLETKLRISAQTSLYPDELYKASLFVPDGENKLFFIGAQEQLYTMTYFDSIASWVCKYICGTLCDEPKSVQKMKADINVWTSRMSKVTNHKDVADFQAALLADLCQRTGYTEDILKAVPLYLDWLKHREEDIADYRKHQFRSIYTGSLAPPQPTFMQAFDESLEGFLKVASNGVNGSSNGVKGSSE